MGSTFASESSMMYFKTDDFETYRMLGILGQIEINHEGLNKIRNKLGEQKYKELSAKRLDMISQITSYYSDYKTFYEYFLSIRDYETIKETMSVLYNTTYGGTAIVADMFCGKGEWLGTFKNFLPQNNYQKTNKAIWTIGTEIEPGRYKIAKKNVDHVYNTAFEDFVMPKHSVSLMLFNPPYGYTDKERNTRRYLRMILEKEYLLDNAIMVFVLRKDDFVDCADLICGNFKVLGYYDVNPEEFEKYKQTVLYAIYKGKISKSTKDVAQFSVDVSDFIDGVKEPTPFLESVHCNLFGYNYFPTVNVYNVINGIELLSQPLRNSSKKSDSRKWMMERTVIIDRNLEKITMPRYPKTSEIANIIASGYIDNADDDSDHLTAGGIKEVTKTTNYVVKDKSGIEVDEMKITRQSIPYLNVLYTKNGKIQFKEIGGDEE